MRACYYCHDSAPKLPGYARLPGIKQLSAYAVATASKAFQIDALFASLQNGTPAPEADLAKLEAIVKDNSMPPALFHLVHWNAVLSEDDRRALLEWIGKQRKAHYATPGVAPEFANEPVQPLPRSIPVDSRKVAIGESLFHDPRLSGDNTVSCASCHALRKGGADGLKTSRGVGGQIGADQCTDRIQCGTESPAVLGRSRRYAAGAGGWAAAQSD
jgi:cytochrome c peroxidase